MTLSEIRQVAMTAENACIVVIDHPADMAARQTLFDVLAPIVNPMSLDHDDLPAYLRGLIRQACSLGEIVQGRNDSSRKEPHRGSFSAVSIQSAARDLQSVFREIIDGLAAGKNA